MPGQGPTSRVLHLLKSQPDNTANSEEKRQPSEPFIGNPNYQIENEHENANKYQDKGKMAIKRFGSIPGSSPIVLTGGENRGSEARDDQ